MNKTLAAGALAVAATLGSAALPPVTAEAAAYECKRYVQPETRRWGYLYCNAGTSWYYAAFRCIHWVGSEPIVYWEIGSVEKAGVGASTAWCPDGFHIARPKSTAIVKYVIP